MPGPTITGRITRTTAIIGTRMSIIGIAGTGIIITTTTTGITTIGINDPLLSPNPSSRMMLACTASKSSKKIPRMKYFALLLLTMSSGVSAADRPPIGTPAMPPVKRRESTRETFQGPDRTITWHPWQERAEFRVRTGDRKAVPDVFLRPGTRYAIVKVHDGPQRSLGLDCAGSEIQSLLSRVRLVKPLTSLRRSQRIFCLW